MCKCQSFLLFGALLLLTNAIGGQCESVPCKLKDAKFGKVCVCTADYCDYLDNPTLDKDEEFALISTSKQGLRFELSKGYFETNAKYIIKDYEEPVAESAASNATILSRPLDQIKESTFALSGRGATRSTITRSVTLKLDRSKRYQRVEGFGGSFTGAVSYLLENYKDHGLKDHLYRSFYANKGLGFNLMRVTIGGCDFDLEAWAYNEKPENGTILTAMDKLDARDVIRVKLIKRLREVSGVKNLRIKGAAWSAPPWMKTNNNWTGYGQLKRKYYQTWADYHLKWVDMMTSNGLPIWAISTGNEPMSGIIFMKFIKFMSMGWTPQNQAVWVEDNLGPTIRNSKYKDLVIFSNDDQRYTIPFWFNQMNCTRPNALKYIDGVALHFYMDELFGNSFGLSTNNFMGDRIQLITESCIGEKNWHYHGPLLGSWERAEKMARTFMGHLQEGFHGWIDWNIILDEAGGPNYVNNTVDAPVIANTTSYTEFYKQPMFYIMGHFSKLVPEGSVHIEAVASNVNLDCVAFVRPDEKIVAVLFNSGRADLDINVVDTVRGNLIVNVPAKSIHTLLYN